MANKILATLLTLALTTPTMWAQAASDAPKLKISILEGQGAVNNIKQRLAREPVVQVTDENDRPVGGALVTFALPQNGPGAVFSNGSTSLTVTADSNGIAQASGMSLNSTKGEFIINVSASHEGQTATAMIGQSNVGGGLSTASIGLIAGAIAAGAVVAILVSQGGDDNGGGSAGGGVTTINPGGGTVSPLTPGIAGRSRGGGVRISFGR